MSSPAELVLTANCGAVRVLTFNRPARLNAWTEELEDQYFDRLEAAADDRAVRAIVVTGAGRGFCSGADLGNLAGVGGVSRTEQVRLRRPRDLPLTIRKPIIGAINGVAAGLGFVEALYCDVRFGGPATRFTTAFARRGLIAEYGIAWLLPRVVGHSRAADLLLSSRMVDAAEAHRIGLIDHFVDGDVLGAAIGYANDLAAQCSPQSMATIKAQLSRHVDQVYRDAVAESETLMHASFQGPDLGEGIASHLEHRAPNFPSLPARSARCPVEISDSGFSPTRLRHQSN
nr:enoyl-CoA hydratase-related protein [Rhodococcus sp. UNC363MFTsu5.1]